MREPVTTGGLPDELVYGDDGSVVIVEGVSTPFGFFSYLLENARMTTDLECSWQSLLNVGRFIPIPAPLVGADDPRMSDARNMLDGSVFDVSVADNAGIVQSKLNLNGNIPQQYLIAPPDEPVVTGAPLNPLELVTGDDNLTVTIGGITYGDAVVVPPELVYGDDGKIVEVATSPASFYAARGDKAQLNPEKGAINGYVPLDSTGRMPLTYYPISVGPGSGTVSSFTLDATPSSMASTPNRVISGAATLATAWNLIGASQWLGNVTGASQNPVFTSIPLNPSMIPGFDSSKVTSGVFNLSRLPIAFGVGLGHAQGIVPDPGVGGAPEDYLARDMTYKTMQPPPSYEPMVPNPSISFLHFSGVQAAITINESLSGSSLFYRINHAGTFIPAPGSSFLVDQGVTVETYAAKIGYQNSNIVSYTVPHP